MDRRALFGLVFAVGLILLLVGSMTDAYTPTVGVLLGLGVWFIGGALVGIFAGKKKTS